MSTTVTQDRYRVGSKSLHVLQQGDLGWSVWLNVEDIDFSGLCLAIGATRSDAQGAAIRVLHMLAGVLERPPVWDDEDSKRWAREGLATNKHDICNRCGQRYWLPNPECSNPKGHGPR